MPQSPPSTLSPRARRTLLNLARTLVSAGLLAWIVSRIGLEQLLATVSGGDPRPYAAALLLSLSGVALRAVRWLILLRAVGARVSFRRTVYLYFVGAFFNTFLPTGFGGDVVRVLEVGPGATSQQAAGTVVVDRLTGFVALFLMALAALPFAAGLLAPATLGLIALMALGVTLGSLLLFEGQLLRALTARFPRALSLAGDAWLGRTYAVITACGPRAIAGAIGISLVFNFMQVLAIGLTARALGLDVPLWTFFVFVPVATAALLVPISISGFGVREGIFVGLFGQVGLGAAQAVALSLGAYSLDLAAGLAGGLIYLAAGLLGLRGRE